MESGVSDNDKLISLVQFQPSLWDNNDPAYADKMKKENAWRMVINSLYGDEEVQSWDLQKKNEIGKLVHFYNLFDNYS